MVVVVKARDFFSRVTPSWGGTVAEWLACWSAGLRGRRPVFKSQSRRCRVTVLGKLLTPIVCYQAAKLVAALLRVAGVTAGLSESNGSIPPGL